MSEPLKSVHRLEQSASAPEPTRVDHLSATLEATVSRFSRMIHAVGRDHGLTEGDVDEVMQEVRIRLWRYRGERKTLAGIGASYVHRAARSAAVDVVRRRRARRTGRDATEPLSPGLAASRGDPATEVERRELARRVFEAVDRLMASRRPVVRMHLAGYGRREIAEVLGQTEGQVRNLLSRGLADLRAALEAEDIGIEDVA